MITPFDEELFANDDVEIRILHYSHPLKNTYRIKVGGFSYVEMDEERWYKLRELFKAFEEEENETFQKKRWWKRG